MPQKATVTASLSTNRGTGISPTPVTIVYGHFLPVDLPSQPPSIMSRNVAMNAVVSSRLPTVMRSLIVRSPKTEQLGDCVDVVGVIRLVSVDLTKRIPSG
jgi:hypothetical protein